MNGEGFAYFRWHAIRWGNMEGTRPVSRCIGCHEWWAEMQGYV